MTCRNRCRFCFVDQVPAGSAPLALGEGRRLSALLPARLLHHADESDGAGRASASSTCASRRSTSRCTPGTTRRGRPSWGGPPAPRAGPGAPRRGGARAPPAGRALPGLERRRGAARDGERTTDLGVEDLGIVPVSLAAEGDLRRVGASRTPSACSTRSPSGRRRAASGWAAPTCTPPTSSTCSRAGCREASDAPLQYENGIGMSAQLLSEAQELATTLIARGGGAAKATATRRPAASGEVRLRLLTGTLAVPVMRGAGGRPRARRGAPAPRSRSRTGSSARTSR